MTVGVVGACGSIIYGATDQMITAGDIEFEGTSKIYRVTSSLALVLSGDASLYAEIATRIYKQSGENLGDSPRQVQSVERTAEMFVEGYQAIKARNAEAAILGPLMMTTSEFFERHDQYSNDFIYNTVQQLQNFPMPEVEAIITGIDDDGAHIYTVLNGELRCHDAVGFAAIGKGARHAEAQFMLTSLPWKTHEAWTALTTYIAKRKAEIAPSVGTQTQVFTIGPEMGSFSPIRTEGLAQMEALYQEFRKAERRTEARAKAKMLEFYEGLSAARKEAEEQ